MALAQTVAGVRQYTVLISLMDNWDSMKNNLNVAANAKGELQAQQDIYDQSWAAAKKRLKSTTEEVYNKIISSPFNKIKYLNKIYILQEENSTSYVYTSNYRDCR